MKVNAIHRSARISAQKTRLVADQIRGLSVDRALNMLAFSPQKAAGIVKKVVESAIANAEHNQGADIDDLKSSVFVSIKQNHSSVRGRAPKGAVIESRSRHVTLLCRLEIKRFTWDKKYIQQVSVWRSDTTGSRAGMQQIRSLRRC